MKKLTAILLLALHLFNTSGYTVVFQYFIAKAETRLMQALDNSNYSEADLIVIKTPLNLPYYNATASAERVDGEIEMDGTHYNYVKRKISNDTLYLYCIPNSDKTKLSAAQHDYSGKVADGQTDSKKENSLLKKMKWGGEWSDVVLHDAANFFKTPCCPETGFIVHASPFPILAAPYKPPQAA